MKYKPAHLKLDEHRQCNGVLAKFSKHLINISESWKPTPSPSNNIAAHTIDSYNAIQMGCQGEILCVIFPSTSLLIRCKAEINDPSLWTTNKPGHWTFSMFWDELTHACLHINKAISPLYCMWSQTSDFKSLHIKCDDASFNKTGLMISL